MNTKNELAAKIAIDKINYESDIFYTYKIPQEIHNKISVGKRVIVPFGRGNSKRKGIIIEFSDMNFDAVKLKSIITVLDEAPFLSPKMLELALWMKNNYFCSLYDAARVILPISLEKEPEVVYNLNKGIDLTSTYNLSNTHNEIIEMIYSNGGKINRTCIIDKLGKKWYNKYVDELLNLGIINESVFSKRSVGEKSLRIVTVKNNTDINSVKLTDKQKKVYEFIKASKGVSAKEVCYFLGVSNSVIDGLVKKNILSIDQKIIYHSPLSKNYDNESIKDYELSEEQKIAYNKLIEGMKSNNYNVSLLYGVTGSGKTAVFIKIIDYALKLGKNIIIMVPEISLTAQIINLFKGRYKEKVSVLHSALSAWERFDEWKKIKEGKSKIAIGTRSAVFAPFDEIGLIILDEEQEYTYKSESLPRFHARDIAKFRCKQSNGSVVLASATPSVESYHLAARGTYNLCELKQRYGKAKLPNVEIVDMNVEMSNGNTSQFSSTMVRAIKENIGCGKQSILFLNRRGYHTFAKCGECGEVLNCCYCNVSLTYHSDNNRLMCHYCGYSRDFSKKCEHCGKEEVYYTGFGTQKAVEQLSKLVPNANVLRMDADTTQKKNSYEKLFNEFKNGNYNIMLGTQMISKGLNFSNVTLVGILLADRALYSDDFRSYERAFSMMTQVVGRAGRGDFEGKAIIQTFTPENSIIELAAKQDYVGFYKSEIEMRKLMLYPPFVDLCVIGFVGKNENITFDISVKFFKELKKTASDKYNKLPLRIFKPTQANINKIGGKYRVRILIKCRNNPAFRRMISEVIIKSKKEFGINNVNVFADINPDTIL